MVTSRYSDQQESKSGQKVMRLYKQWHQPISKRFIKPPYLLHIESNLDRVGMLPPTHDQRSQQKNGKIKNYAPTSFDEQVQVSTRRTTHELTQLCCITHVSGSTTTQLCCLTHMSGSTTTQLCCTTHPSGKYYHSVVLYNSFE